MSNQNALGERMKEYEYISRTSLMRRNPVIIRLDGKAFHTFTRNMQKPFDQILIKTMQSTMLDLCQNIQGCVLGYAQSDEISLLLVDYKALNSEAWFDYEIQKIVSISASMATLYFNSYFRNYVSSEQEFYEFLNDANSEYADYLNNLINKFNKAMFDSRVFSLPKEEITNYFYWRQQDATRNSIQMCGQYYFSHNELQHKSCDIIQDMLFTQKGINWNNFSTTEKRGSCAKKNKEKIVVDMRLGEKFTRPAWGIDYNIPIFLNEGRNYIDELILI